MRARVVVLTITALAVTACSNGNDATPTTTTTPTSSTTTTTTTTTAAPTTSTTSTTTRPPTSTATAPASTTEHVDETQEVLDSLQVAWQAFNAALVDPTSDDVVAAARALLADRTLATFEERIERFRAEDLRAEPNPSVPARIEVRDGTVVIDGDTTTMVVCDVDSYMLVEVGAAPDGGDAIVNDRVVARLLQVEMRRSDTGWLLAGAAGLAEYVDQADCEDS